MQKQGNTNYQKNIGSAALLALAILVLVVSCPLKRLLINNFSSQTSVASKSNPANSNQNFIKLSGSNATCSADNSRIVLLQADKTQHKKANAPVFTINIFNHTGYYIHSFLDGIKTEPNLVSNSDHPSLPLFLLHRNLLI